ncbi:uncharacterized protein LOC119722809 [Patiria miniata]|uniref:Orexin-A n=1 Tax=Patiria miniata TaxID=46514 RepID=A0A913ZDR1_PATMI|nr:uncharacterized protein LOC119722809 [Patiria miniata]XP_038049090.1 uncharacterized protein LOC119722809 [Patiria miniata]
MRTATLFVLQTVVVIGYLACTSTAGNACCKGTCHEIPKGCNCPYKAVLCGELNTLTMGKRKSGDPYQTVMSPQQQQYQQRRPQLPHSRADRRLDDGRIVGVLNNLLKLLKETHQADQDAFDVQDQNDNEDWEAVTSSRKQASEHAQNVFRRQSLFAEDVY